jgi:AraC-like DNA-binding protein
MNRAALGHVAIGVAAFRRGVEISNAESLDKYFLCFSRRRRGMLRHPDTEVPIVPGLSGAIASPFASGRLFHSSGYRSLTIAIRRQALESAWMALSGATRPPRLEFAPGISVSSGKGADILRLIRFILRELDRANNLLSAPLIAASLTDALVFSLLTGQPHNYSADSQPRSPRAEPRYVRQVEEYLAAHAADPISLQELSTLVGLSIRAIQAGFKSHRGYSPMAFLKERRLELAHKRLLGALPGATVSEIALESGFANLGRFSMTYRRRFGEAPSETLRNAARRGCVKWVAAAGARLQDGRT